jgi:multisubunit Na+/H+ antiporter MnhG subunit
MNFDLRLPIGILFSFYGVVLVLFGALGNKEIYQRSLGMNINLIWGAVLLLFGLMMLALAWRSVRRSVRPD